MFVLKIVVLYDNLTRIQSRSTYAGNILCLIFVCFDECEDFLMEKNF